MCSVQGQVVNACFASHASTMQLCCFDLKVAKGSKEMNERDWVAIKLYLHTKEGRRLALACSVQFSNPSSGLFSF